MGASTCKCLSQDSKTLHQQLLNNYQPQQKARSATIQNRIKTIASISTQPPLTNRKQKQQYQPTLTLHSHNKSFTIDPIQEIQTIGTVNEAENHQITPQSEDDVFLLSIKYSSSNRQSSGGYYARDEGIGLGCFYKLRPNETILLKNRCLIGIGNLFILPMINQMSISSSNFKDLNVEIKIFGGTSQGQTFKINNSSPGHLLIGNSPQCAIRLKDGSVGGVCAILRKEEDELVLSGYGGRDIWVYMSHTTKLENDMILKCGVQYYKVEIE